MQIAVLTFDGFNELDSFIAAHITSPTAEVTSTGEADAVLIGSSVKTRYIEHALGVVTPFIASAPALVA